MRQRADVPLEYDDLSPGVYWAQFFGPLELVLVERSRSGVGFTCFRFGDSKPHYPIEFRFWKRLEESPVITPARDRQPQVTQRAVNRRLDCA